MAGFEFEAAWRERRVFRVEGVEIPVARLTHIVTSKAKANRPKDRLFLETHAEALKDFDGRLVGACRNLKKYKKSRKIEKVRVRKRLS